MAALADHRETRHFDLSGGKHLREGGEVAMNAACDERGTNTQLAAGAEEEGEGAAVAQHLAEGEAGQRHDGDGHERLGVTACGEDDGDADGLGQVAEEQLAASAVDEAEEADDAGADGLATREAGGARRREHLAGGERLLVRGLVHDAQRDRLRLPHVAVVHQPRLLRLAGMAWMAALDHRPARQPVVQCGVALAPGGAEGGDGQGVVGEGEGAGEGDVAGGVGDGEGEGVAAHVGADGEGNRSRDEIVEFDGEGV